jgi:hypothetical protein
MMRASLILVAVGSLVAIEFGTPPRAAKAIDQPLDQSTVGAADSRNTLAKPDRLEIHYFQNELPVLPISFERRPPADSTPVISKEAAKTVGSNRHDAKTEKVAVVRTKPRPKIPDSEPWPKTWPKTWPNTTDSNTVANTSRSKLPIDVTPCRSNPFDSFLEALNLRSGCKA